METEARLVDFYNGAHLLEMVAGWAYVVANREAVLEQLASFESAYEELVNLHAAGKLGAGEADFSAENLELVKHIRRLLQPGLDNAEAHEVAIEVRTLAERCLRALTRGNTSPGIQGAT